MLKSDNGSAFIAGELRELCERWGVELLWSPPRTPRYNSAIKSGIRWLQERTEHLALSGGRPGLWTAEDLEVARTFTNHLPRRPRELAVSRGGVLGGRSSITPQERAALMRGLPFSWIAPSSESRRAAMASALS